MRALSHVASQGTHGLVRQHHVCREIEAAYGPYELRARSSAAYRGHEAPRADAAPDRLKPATGAECTLVPSTRKSV